MLSTITTLFGFVSDCFKVFEKRPIKFTIYLMIFLSIVLVKPVVYYSTLYRNFCLLFLTIICALFLFLIGYIFLHKKYNESYDYETVTTLLAIYGILILFLIMGIFKGQKFFENYFMNTTLTETEFIQIIHDTIYFEKLYNYVFLHWIIILFYCFEFIQMISLIYLIFFILDRLFTTNEPLKSGYLKTQFDTIIANFMIVIMTSPITYDIYNSFLIKIF